MLEENMVTIFFTKKNMGNDTITLKKLNIFFSGTLISTLQLPAQANQNLLGLQSVFGNQLQELNTGIWQSK